MNIYFMNGGNNGYNNSKIYMSCGFRGVQTCSKLSTDDGVLDILIIILITL